VILAAPRFGAPSPLLGDCHPPFAAFGACATPPHYNPTRMSTTESRAVAVLHLAFLLLCIWLGTVLFVFLRQMSGLLTERDFTPNFYQPVRFFTLYFWMPWLALAPLVAILARRLPIRPERWLWPICANVLLFLALSVAHALCIAFA
jgi:hypothetical protein